MKDLQMNELEELDLVNKKKSRSGSPLPTQSNTEDNLNVFLIKIGKSKFDHTNLAKTIQLVASPQHFQKLTI